MAQPQYAMANWWLSAIKDGRMKVGDTFECRQYGKMPVTPEDLGCSTVGSIYGMMSYMIKAGLFTRAGDGHLAVSDLWEACGSADDVIALIKQGRPVYKPGAKDDDAEEEPETAPEPEPEPPLQFDLFSVLDQLNESERISVAVGLIHSLTTRAPDLERAIAELKAELTKRDQETQRLIDIHEVELKTVREELKTERANAMILRQELENRRVSVARTIEKIVTVDSGKTAPTAGGQWGRTGAGPGPRVVMHRKPAVGHVPRVVREQLANGHTKNE